MNVLHGYHNAFRNNLWRTTSTWIPSIERPILLIWIRDRNPFTKLQPILFKCGEDLVVVGFRRNFSEIVPRLILYVDLHLYKNAHSLATCFFRHLQKNYIRIISMSNQEMSSHLGPRDKYKFSLFDWERLETLAFAFA